MAPTASSADARATASTSADSSSGLSALRRSTRFIVRVHTPFSTFSIRTCDMLAVSVVVGGPAPGAGGASILGIGPMLVNRASWQDSQWTRTGDCSEPTDRDRAGP